jgi:type I restriction enzyme, R subunit
VNALAQADGHGDQVLEEAVLPAPPVVRRNATIDWDKKDQVRASLRRYIRRLLAKYRYPPDRQEAAVALVMQQAELFGGEFLA